MNISESLNTKSKDLDLSSKDKKKAQLTSTENFDFLTELNERQKKAVLSKDKRICVIAGPGCGKTKTLTSRVLYLLKSQRATAEQILLLTFSKKAIREIEKRITNSLGTSWFDSIPTIANLHSFCYQFLRKYSSQLGFVGNSFPLYDQKDQVDLVKKILIDRNFPLSTDNKEISTIVRLISLAKVMGDKNFALLTGRKKLVAQEYQKYLILNQALDFNDLLLITIKILEQFPKIRSEYQTKFTNILVDEFQDINQIQWKLINLLLGEKQTLFLVGDPNQSIYGFQGSSPTLISSLQSERKWTKIYLNINYRSTGNILQVGNNFLANHPNIMVSNFLQTTKELGTIVSIIRSFSVSTVVRQILYFIRNQAIKLSEIVVLYRSNYLSVWLEQELINQKIPYEILGSFKFIEREEIKDTLAYLRAIFFQDDLSLLRILKLVSGVGAKAIATIEKASSTANQLIFAYLQAKQAELKNTAQSKKKDNLSAFLHLLNFFRKKSYQSGKLSTFVKEVLHHFNYFTHLTKKSDAEERTKNIQQFLNILQMWEKSDNNFSNFRETGLEFLQYCTVSFEDKKLHQNRDNIILSTVHQAKGLEFEIVFFVYLDDGNLPLKKTQNLAEEMRIFYVGITRAKRVLYLVNNKSTPSPFLAKIGLR